MTSLPDVPDGPAAPGLAAPGPAVAGAPDGGTGPRGRPSRRPARGWPLRRTISVAIGVLAAFSVAAIVTGSLALHDLSTARSQVVAKLDPASFQASQLYAALLNQETAVRGYALTADRSFLVPYGRGMADQRRSASRLRQLLTGLPGTQAELAQVTAGSGQWRTQYAQPAIAQIAARGKPLLSPAIQQGKAEFDSLRAPLSRLQASLATQRRAALASLSSSARELNAACILIAIGLLVIVAGLALGGRRAVLRPLSRVASDARRVANGDFEHQVGRTGPRELQGVGEDVELMRQRILQELSALRANNITLEERTLDLQRSNAELEQFAYVASHDLQEPLRKVASFCQLLQRRYSGRLDERADQYIEYAVDGAKRMQVLINDLLAFSRVGRSAESRELVDTGEALGQARANLAEARKDARAVIDAGELPVVLGEPALITAVFQNLISNALKFRGEQPPHVRVTAEREDGFWVFSVTDNGIGIPEEYADRIFVIFQRLHDRAAYSGTGIGLAMCRKIIEYFGGRIWLDTAYSGGSRFCFTLPARVEENHADDE
jgi:signal transduction histidine kinase